MISLRVFFLTVVSFCLLTLNVYAVSGVKDFKRGCPIFVFYYEDRKDSDETVFKFFDTVEIQFRKNTISKITKFDALDDQLGTENNGLKININRALEKNLFVTGKDTSQQATHIFEADSGQYYKVKTTNSKTFNKKIYSFIEVYVATGYEITGLVVVCSKKYGLISLTEFTSSIDVNLKDLKISLLNNFRDLDMIPATEFEIRKNEIIENKFPITKQLEQARALYRDGKFKCKKYQKRMYEILKIDYFHQYECDGGSIYKGYIGPIAAGYLPSL